MRPDVVIIKAKLHPEPLSNLSSRSGFFGYGFGFPSLFWPASPLHHIRASAVWKESVGMSVPALRY